MKKKKAYVAQAMITSLDLNTYPKPTPVPVSSFADNCVGMCPVFRTKTSARKVFGKNVELNEISYFDK